MRWIEDIRTDLAELDVSTVRLRRFGLLMAVVLLAVVLFTWWARGAMWWNATNIFLFALAGYFLVSAFVFAQGLRLLYRLWMGLAFILGWFVSRIILIFLFYTVLTLLGVLARLFGKKFMDTKRELQAETYWKPVNNSETDLTRMY